MSKLLISLFIAALSYTSASTFDNEVDCKLCKIMVDKILDRIETNSTIQLSGPALRGAFFLENWFR